MFNPIGPIIIGMALCTAPLNCIAQNTDAPSSEILVADSPKTTVFGNTFIAPEGWTLSVRGPATILEAPERDSWIALIDVKAKNADEALAAGWASYKDIEWPLKLVNDLPDKDGWSKQRQYEYQTSPNERRSVFAGVMFAGDAWTVWIYDMAHAVGDKRGSQVALVFDKLLPKGYSRETFAGKKANRLDKARIAMLSKFVEDAQLVTGVPGVSVGILQDGKVVFAGGFGVRELGKPTKVDADTLYMIASNSKGLTTLLLAKLVDQGKLDWQTAVTSLLPTFKVGDADTTSRILVEHLVCACTGMPRQDMEWLLQYDGVTPAGVLLTLATMQPTSDFGDLFQYSNLLASAAGFVAGHVMFPTLELGTAYDRAMQAAVFDPLGMKATTFDFGRALAGNYADAHAPDIDGNPARAVFDLNYSAIPIRPSGAAWSNINDMLKYVAMELAEGVLPNGERYIAKEPLLERRESKVAIGDDATYGMGLMVDTTYDVSVVHHGGDMVGYHSDMMWLPDYNVGAVILTNGDPGWLIRNRFQRKLLEVLFDGKPEADVALTADGKRFFDQMAADRKLLAVPANSGDAGKLAAHYSNHALGEIAVSHPGAATVFDFGEWKSEVASRNNPDGTVSFTTIAPGINGLEFVVGSKTKRTLVLRDAQHEYVFDET